MVPIIDYILMFSYNKRVKGELLKERQMNAFLSRLEKKIGKYAIARLPLYMIICYAVGYVLIMVNPSIIYFISLDPYAILHGEVWRIFTWVMIPPDTSNIFFTLITLYFYYSIGITLERTWGTFYFNVYIFSGLIFTLIGAFMMYGYVMLFAGGSAIPAELLKPYFRDLSLFFSTYYISMSIFLGFAATYPDMQVLLMFIIPIKVKVLAVIYAAILVWEGVHMGVMGLFVIGASLLNFIVFFISTRKNLLVGHRRTAQQKAFRREVKQMEPRKIAKHKCAICGRTSEEYPDLEFRFCSKCEGNYEYCQEHIFTHKHFKRNGG